ncbi:MAG: DNA cytosine methyltransferase [Bacteroidales bacterium]|nr:DNA cytosine methyltransferase [Bacteroidales bacterium]
MLEFYYTYHPKNFKTKAKQLAAELLSIFKNEKIKLESTEIENIPQKYFSLLGNDLFTRLNNIYYTIRQNNGINHSLLKKYLPELKQEPISDFLFADFFSGAGGLSQGLINTGFQPAFVNDNYTTALETYYFNHTLQLSHFFNGDIKELVENFDGYKHLFKGVKIICGGPPCQGFSTANRWNFEIEKKTKEKRFIEDERNVLYKYFVKLIGLIKPDFFIMENVKGMMRVEKQIEEDIQKETKHEYSFIPLELDAQNFNIPQSRKRYILVGGKNFMFIKLFESIIKEKKNGMSKYKLADALYGLPVIGTNPFKLKSEFESDRNGYAIRKFKIEQNEFLEGINGKRQIDYLFNHKSRYNNENDLEIFRTLPEGENSLHPSVQKLSNYNNRNHIFKDKYYKLKQNEVSKTITSHMKYDCHMYIHPTQARGLSPREAARIQTFPDDYVFRGSLNDWYKQIGNAVPVKLAEVISSELMKYYT